MVKAGIDPETWRTELGTDANWDTISRVHEYYGQLFLDNPELQWAGMANMIGPSFAGGFKDLAMFRDLLQQASPIPALPPPLQGLLAHLTDEELSFYETALLDMQKEIFEDQARQHEAFLGGGLPEIRRLKDAGVIDLRTFEAWENVASGDPTRVAGGNRELLRREQRNIIHDNYDEMRARLVTGEAMTQLITLIGAPSIPGAQAFPEVFSDGNISVDEHRWALIEQDTLPVYQDLVTNQPDRTRELIESDFNRRADDTRMLNRIPEVLARLLGGFTGDQDPPKG